MKRTLTFITSILILTACQGRFNPKKPTYQISGIIPRVVDIPKHEVKPIDRAAIDLIDTGVIRIRWGLGICLAAFCVSIMFANPLTARLSNYALIGGGFVAGDGFMLVFMGEYLIWFCVLFIALFGILLWARKKSIVTLWKGRKNDKNIKS